MVDFVKWALTDGQKYCARARLRAAAADVVKLEMAALAKIKVGVGSAHLAGQAARTTPTDLGFRLAPALFGAVADR